MTDSRRAAQRGPASGGAGVVYLLHFSVPYRHARHYTGWTTDLPARLATHQAGHGARLLTVITEHGIAWALARTWSGSRHRERALKRQGGAARRCPLCGVRPRRNRDVGQADTATPDAGRREADPIHSGSRP